MTLWLHRLSDESFRSALGRRFEAISEEAFHVLRWCIMTGLARYLARTAPSVWFDAIHWGMSALLFGYLASRFLLRPEVPIFARTDRRWKRVVQTLVNYGLCMLAFLLVMMALNHLADGVARYQFAHGVI